ncbi:MAG: extracellular solute-binding protein [Defluviitaleaceae bacterium]|nr:extracellular solute-binding protein [Defluviitaleaceae bacterium]
MKKLFFAVILIFALTTGCATANNSPLDASNPVNITLWNYYTGVLLSTFDMMVAEFNQTVGLERGIILESISFGNMGGVESNLRSSINEEAGSLPLPNIFSSFPDTAYFPQRIGLLVNLDYYLSAEQLHDYYEPFVYRGRIGVNNELYIIPVAMATEIMLINETDWLVFANESGFSFYDLHTMESLSYVARAYYYWSGGKAFWGRDAMANIFVIGSKMFGTEIFEISEYNNEARATININYEVMRRIWDFYYTPFISGYFAADANFRTDDVRVGDLLAFVGSTAAAAFFPEDVTIDSETHNITARALPPPGFFGASNVLVKQGAGKAVMNATEQEVYASVVFLRWLTEPEQNLRFSAASGRIPVRRDAMYVDLIRQAAYEAELTLSEITYQTLQVAMEAIKNSELYSTCAFTGAIEARAVLTNNLRNKAEAGRMYVLEQVEAGIPREEIISALTADENFHAWVSELREALVNAVG